MQSFTNTCNLFSMLTHMSRTCTKQYMSVTCSLQRFLMALVLCAGTHTVPVLLTATCTIYRYAYRLQVHVLFSPTRTVLTDTYCSYRHFLFSPTRIVLTYTYCSYNIRYADPVYMLYTMYTFQIHLHICTQFSTIISIVNQHVVAQ